MIMPRYMPPDAYFDDPATKLDPAPRDDSLAFALAGGGITRVQEWITRGRGGAKQRGLRSDLVTLCIFARIFCPANVPPRAGARGSMAFPASGPRGSSRNLPVN